MRLRIEVPVSVYDEIRHLQHQVLAYEIDPDDARTQLADLIAPYTTYTPGADDYTEIVLQKRTISLPSPRGIIYKGGTLRV